MPEAPAPATRSTPRPSWIVARVVARRAIRSGALWGSVFGVYVYSSASSYAGAYPTLASRQQFARSYGTNVGIRALIGPARHLDTAAGFTAWRCVGVLALVGAVWGLLTGTRLLRGEEDAGRWEVLLAGPTTRGQATARALAGLAAGWVTLFAATALLSVAGGQAATPSFTPGDALFLALAATSSAGVFLALGALTSQLGATRRRAAALAGGVFGAAYVLRMVADSDPSLGWLRWLTPLGWVQELRPLTGARPILLLALAGLTVGLGGLAVRVARARDVGSSVLPDRDRAPTRTGLLGSPAGLAVRLARPAGLAWVAGVGAGALFFGLVAQSAANAVSGSATIQKAIGRLGGASGGTSAYLGLTFVVLATAVTLVAAGQVGATREEEADGRLENLLARAVSRPSWLAGRLATTVAIVVACGVAAGVLAWVGAASQHSGVSFERLLEAGVNIVPPALFVLGVGTLVHGALPRGAAAVSYAVVAWSFLIELVGSVIKASHWLLDTSVLYHVAPAPAANPNWGSAAGLAAVGAGAAALGGYLFTRRDLVGA